MLHHCPHFHAQSGIGDMLWTLPILGTCQHPCVLTGPEWYAGKGVEKIMAATVPNVRPKFEGKMKPGWWRFMWGDFLRDSPPHLHYAARYGLSPEVSFPATVIDRLPRMRRDNSRILFHPMPANESRKWGGWGDLDLSGIKAVGLGSESDPRTLRMPYFLGDFYDLAKLMLASRGVVCIVSSVFHLARILAVPTICIHVVEATRTFFPGNAVDLFQPTPAEVERAIEETFL